LAIVDTRRIAAFGPFADLPVTELDELAAVVNEVEVEAGVQLTTSDDDGHFIYFVEAGEADVLTDDGEVAESIGPGDTFGEIAVLVTGQRTATVVTRTPMALLSLFDPDFQRIRARVPEFERSIRRLGSERLNR
jgi:CRP-like cAMP-binding protein